MVQMALAMLVVLATIYVVPLIVYGVLSAKAGLKPPEGSPGRFLSGVLVSKIGTAFAFVLLFAVSRGPLSGDWVAYAAIWWLMNALGEVGQAIGPRYSWAEAAAGVLSEAVYFPLSAYATGRLLG
jgi:hypothetical protein